MKRLSIILITIVLFTTMVIPAIAQDHDWWILNPGAWKWYKDALDHTKELHIWATPGGPGMANLHFDYIQNDIIVEAQVLLLSKDPTGDFWWHGIDGDLFREYGNHSIVNPLLIVDEPLWVGKAWADTIYNSWSGADLLYNFECVDETDVVTPIGVFPSFEIKYEIRYGFNWSGQFIERKWHCDGAGLVKFILQGYPLQPDHSGEYELVNGVSDVETPSSPRISINNHPNPFNPETTVHFSLDQATWARVEIYDFIGRKIALLADRVFSAGPQNITWTGRDENGRAMPSGAYIVRLETESETEAKKISLIR